MANEYNSVLCKYCPCTDYGLQSINSGPHNLCEGRSCFEAYNNYVEEFPEELDARILDDFF